MSHEGLNKFVIKLVWKKNVKVTLDFCELGFITTTGNSSSINCNVITNCSSSAPATTADISDVSTYSYLWPYLPKHLSLNVIFTISAKYETVCQSQKGVCERWLTRRY